MSLSNKAVRALAQLGLSNLTIADVIELRPVMARLLMARRGRA